MKNQQLLLRHQPQAALDRYKQALGSLNNGQPETLLPVLFARDHIEQGRQQSLSFSDSQALTLLQLDEQLRQQTSGEMRSVLPSWRKTFDPPQKSWWWFLDVEAEKREAEKHEAEKREAEKREAEKREAEKREAQNDLLWEVLTGTLLVLIFPLALDIIQRLWDGAPDGISIIGTLITLILTGSPLTKRGQEVARFLTARIPRFQARFLTVQTPRFQARFHHQAMAGMALFAFVVLLVIKFVGFPFLASYYNRQGLAAIDRHPTLARQNFQRVVALDAEIAVGYYHLGVVYEQIGQPEEAISWYQQAIEHQLDLGEAYSNLGRLYILQSNPQQALQVLHAGRIHSTSRTKEERFIRYKLLSNLGWAYFELKQPQLAREVLQEALQIEREVPTDRQSVVPHYHLALIYEVEGAKADALAQWEISLRYIASEKEKKPEQWQWEQTIHEHLDQLRKEMP